MVVGYSGLVSHTNSPVIAAVCLKSTIHLRERLCVGYIIRVLSEQQAIVLAILHIDFSLCTKHLIEFCSSLTSQTIQNYNGDTFIIFLIFLTMARNLQCQSKYLG